MSTYDLTPRVDEFSDGYYLLTGLTVVPSDDRYVPRMQSEVFEYLNTRYYNKRPVPLLIRHNEAQSHFEVQADDSVPTDEIEVPYELTRDFGVEYPPESEPLLLAKPRHAHHIRNLERVGNNVIDRL
jgi:hypothetical protein